MAIPDNDVSTVRSITQHGRQIIALAAAAGLLWWAHHTHPGPARLAAVVGAILLVGVSVLLPRIDTRRFPQLPVPPANPTDDQAFMYQLQMLVLDIRGDLEERLDEHDEALDTVLEGLQSSANGVACTAGRLRRRLDRRNPAVGSA